MLKNSDLNLQHIHIWPVLLTQRQVIVDNDDILYPNISCRHMDDWCEICNLNEKEVYQLDMEVCFDCWMNETNPKIFTECVTF